MKRQMLYFICLLMVVVVCPYQAQGQIFDDFGPPTPIPVPSDVISMSVENIIPEERLDEENILWLLSNSGHVSSSDGRSSFQVSAGSKAIAVNNRLFVVVNKMVDDTVNTYWLEQYDKITGDLLQSNRIFGNDQSGSPIKWGTNGGITALAFHKDTLFIHLNGGFSMEGGVYRCSYSDSTWAEWLFWPACYSGLLIRPFALLRDSTGWLVSDTSRTNRGIFMYPTDAHGFTYSIGSEDPMIGSILAMSGSLQNLWILARDNSTVTVYHYQSPVSADERWPQEKVQTTTTFEMFPNPTNGWVRISGLNNGEHQITIHNILGQQVAEFTFLGTGRKIELPKFLGSGFFLVKVDDSVKRLQLVR
ncbi:T9SS type A sorting domain-containing protein [Patescibacteria group bacterium]|nr:T9SS type A sorting domain-containing protein [Patescibacteria group bacterium]